MEKVVFTNGCFDIIHPGHLDLFKRARALGTKLIVGINSDKSVRAIKGLNRPFVKQEDRKAILEGLKEVDEVKVFNELTPENLIKEIKPNVLVKGGDWAENEIIGADFVKGIGGEVFSLKLKEGYSSSSIVKRIQDINGVENDEKKSSNQNLFVQEIDSHIDLIRKIKSVGIPNLENCAFLIYETLKKRKKILLCGNGLSALTAQYFAIVLVERFEVEKFSPNVIALYTKTSQVETIANTGDLLIAISPSGNSPNVISAVMLARNKGCKILGMTGEKGKKLASLCDECLLVPAGETARIHEIFITVSNMWIEFIEQKFADKNI